MKSFKKCSIVVISLLFGCDMSAINGGYHNIGKYGTKVEGQNGAIADILKNYGTLPSGRHYKIQYEISKTEPNKRSPNALWYSKDEAQLYLEEDIGSGYSCRWSGVTRAVLEQASKDPDGLTRIDSTAKPNQPIGQCK